MTDERELAFQIAQLRHAYTHLLREGKREFADGLIAPAIRFLEQMQRDFI